jgi:hypothetical protein
VIVSAVILIACLMKRNKRAPLAGMECQ